MKSLQILLILSLSIVIPTIGISQTDSDLKLAKALEKSGRYEEALIFTFIIIPSKSLKQSRYISINLPIYTILSRVLSSPVTQRAAIVCYSHRT